jgi:hypothetical protein
MNVTGVSDRDAPDVDSEAERDYYQHFSVSAVRRGETLRYLLRVCKITITIIKTVATMIMKSS